MVLYVRSWYGMGAFYRVSLKKGTFFVELIRIHVVVQKSVYFILPNRNGLYEYVLIFGGTFMSNKFHLNISKLETALFWKAAFSAEERALSHG